MGCREASFSALAGRQDEVPLKEEIELRLCLRVEFDWCVMLP
jgi:hypothetical protein